jgi:hypothetical protein
MITKRETSACVTNDISLELVLRKIYKRVSALKDTSLKSCSSPKRRKVKAKVWEFILLINNSSPQLACILNYHILSMRRIDSLLDLNQLEVHSIFFHKCISPLESNSCLCYICLILIASKIC